ncbi:DNA cytosine methyltransferase [Candidatus Pelagibacter bacterium]|nr:DNA cytosine methyltransferase [Candidatus Pelagibacter bacterium]
MKKIKALSFFSGAMGLDIGLEKAGIDVILACESEKFIRETIKLNRPKIKVLEDINNYSAKEIRKEAGLKPKEKIDLIVGGPPCQAFSTAGKRLSINENRGVVFLKYLELIKELNPTYFVIENVRGLLSVPLKHVPHNKRNRKLKVAEEKGGTLNYILNYLNKIGYKVSFNLYNSANFGTPQTRERIVIIGNKEDKLPYLSPTHSQYGEFGLKPWNTFKSAVKGLHNIKHDHVNFPKSRLKYYRKLKEGQNWRNLSLKLQKEALGKSFYLGGGKTGFLRRLAWNKPSPTLVTDPMMPATDLGHPVEDRPLSIQEYKRIQEFPDNWKFSGSIRNQYKQIGNAVPVSLGKAIGKLIVNHMLRKKIKVINNFKYSRYLNTSDLDWQNSLTKKVATNQKSFRF